MRTRSARARKLLGTLPPDGMEDERARENDVATVEESAVQAWFEVMSVLVDAVPGGSRYANGLEGRILVTGTGVARLNGVYNAAREPDLVETGRLMSRMAAEGTAWCLQVRGGPDEAMVREAAGHGLAPGFTLPFMTAPLEPGVPSASGDGIRIRQAASHDAAGLAVALDAGEAEREELLGVVPLLDAVVPYELDGVPVPDPERAIEAICGMAEWAVRGGGRHDEQRDDR